MDNPRTAVFRQALAAGVCSVVTKPSCRCSPFTRELWTLVRQEPGETDGFLGEDELRAETNCSTSTCVSQVNIALPHSWRCPEAQLWIAFPLHARRPFLLSDDAHRSPWVLHRVRPRLSPSPARPPHQHSLPRADPGGPQRFSFQDL